MQWNLYGSQTFITIPRTLWTSVWNPSCINSCLEVECMQSKWTVIACDLKQSKPRWSVFQTRSCEFLIESQLHYYIVTCCYSDYSLGFNW
jgi:hypothetical protein